KKAYAFSLDAEALAIQNDRQLENWLFRHLRGYMLDGVDKPIFAGFSDDQALELARQSLQQALADVDADVPPLQRIWHLFVTQRLRRETTLSMTIFGSQMNVRLPYLDNDLVDLLLAAPPTLKLDETIQ